MDKVETAVLSDQEFDEMAIPIWEQLAAIGESAHLGAWDSVPKDLSKRIDDNYKIT